MEASTDDEEAEPPLEPRSVRQPFLPCARLRAPVSAATLSHSRPSHTAQGQPRFERGGGHRSGAPDGRGGASHRDGVRQGLEAREPTGRRRLGAGAPPAQPLVPFACSSPRTQRAHTRPDRLHSAALDSTRPGGPSPLPCLPILDALHACTARSSAQLDSVTVALASVDPSAPPHAPAGGGPDHPTRPLALPGEDPRGTGQRQGHLAHRAHPRRQVSVVSGPVHLHRLHGVSPHTRPVECVIPDVPSWLVRRSRGVRRSRALASLQPRRVVVQCSWLSPVRPMACDSDVYRHYTAYTMGNGTRTTDRSHEA